MYNEELKRRFIDDAITSEGRKYVASTLFNRLEEDELVWCADICTKSKEDVLPVVAKLCGNKGRTPDMVLSVLQGYARWCIKHEVPGATDGLLQVKEVDGNSMKTHMVSGPAHLNHYLNSAFDPESMCTIDLIYRCFYWLAFAGVEEGDATSILSSAVDLDNRSLAYDGRILSLCDECMKTVELCVTKNEFLYIRPDGERWRRRNGVGYLLGGYRGAPNFSTIRVEARKKAKVQKFRDVLDPDHTDARLDFQSSYFRVWISGLFYRIYLKECAGEEVSFHEDISRSMHKRNYKLDKAKRTEDNTLDRMCVEYGKDYLRWKEAFSL
ncbi:MAG: hypothetical protein LUD69_04645 [Oscillospiraceae bacterium]|nr:hypothetical protein [Oscillospiraceae bacterium]